MASFTSTQEAKKRFTLDDTKSNEYGGTQLVDIRMGGEGRGAGAGRTTERIKKDGKGDGKNLSEIVEILT